MNIVDQVFQTIKKYNMVNPGDLVIVALSGGPDSLALLHILLKLKNQLKIKLHAAHLDHGLRGEESTADAVWVSKQCELWNVSCTQGFWDGAREFNRGQSPEEAARYARLKFLEKVKEDSGAAVIAQGHHGDDQAETMVMRLLHGAGLRGLGGIKPVRGSFIRPLIKLTRQQVIDYCQAEGLEPRQDSSNQSDIYLRNHIRHHLMPKLKKYNPKLTQVLGQTAELIQLEDQFLDSLASQSLKEISIFNNKGSEQWPCLDIDQFNKLNPVLARRVIRLWVSFELDYGSVVRVCDLAFQGRIGSLAELNGPWLVKRGYRELRLISKEVHQENIKDRKKYQEAEQEAPYGHLKLNETLDIPQYQYQMMITWVALDELYLIKEGKNSCALEWDQSAELPVLRNRQPGDWIQFSYGRKKLKDWFIDHKIPKEERDGLLVLAWGQQILWIPGRLRGLSPFNETLSNGYLSLIYKKVI